MKRILFSLVAILATNWVFGQASCSPSYVPKPFQDCPGALTLCNIENAFDDNTVCGVGRVPDEAYGSCGTHERTSTWYQFKARRPGRLRFRIIPNDVTAPALTNYSAGTGQGNTDYDFVLFKLPAGTTEANASTCALVHSTSGNPSPLQISCNYSGARGVTGLFDELGAAGNGRFDNANIQVQTNDFFILLVDNFTVTTVGYKILFDDPDSLATATDVRAVTNPPRMVSIDSIPNCKSNRLFFSFSTPVLCQDVNTFTFAVTNAHYPNQVFTIDSIRSVARCVGATSTSQQFTLSFHPLIVDSTYTLTLRAQISDICGNTLTHDSLPFRIRPFIRLESFISEGTIKQDTACCNTPIVFKATPDENLRARVSSFAYTFYTKDSASGLYTVLPSGLFTVDSNRVSTTYPCKDNPIREKIQMKVIVRNPRFACVDSAFHSFKYNPEPRSPFDSIPALCFGETAQIALNQPSDTSLYHYTWSSVKVPTPKLTKNGIFTLVADTINSVDPATGEVHRGKNDELKVNVRFKDKFGGCSVPEQRRKVRVGSYIRAGYILKNIDRGPAGKPTPPITYVLPDLHLIDTSYANSLEPTKGKKAHQIWTITNASNQSAIGSIDTLGPIDSLVYRLPSESNYHIKLVMRDSIAPNKVCEKSMENTVECVYPEVQTILTRNGDNTNDYFEIPGLLVQLNYTLTVFNRWGRKVFDKSQYDNSFNGSDLPSGTYFYNLEPTAGSGPAYKGWLEITDK